MSQSYSLTVQSLDGFSWESGLLHKEKPNLYVGIDLDGTRVHRTHTINRDLVPKWSDVCALSSDQLSTRLSLHVYHKSSIPFTDDSCLATVDIDIGTLREQCGTLGTSEKAVALELTKKDTKIKYTGTLSVCLAAIGIVEAGKIEVTSAQKDIQALGKSPAVSAVTGAVDTIAKVQSKAGDIESSLSIVISKLKIIVQVGDELAKIHPYATVAWKVLMFVYEAVKQQRETDEKIVELVGTMEMMFSFVEDTASLPGKIKGLEDTCLAIVKQTVECAMFIRGYIGKGFIRRVMSQVLLDTVTQRIDDLSKALNMLKQAFDSRLNTHTAFVCTTINENVQSLVESEVLRALQPVDMNAALRTKCLTGTRIDILNFIHEWLTTPSGSSNILWLYGVAGSGKSTISTTVSEYFRNLERLGAFIFFDRNDRVASHPSTVIRTIATQLANSYPIIRAAISGAIKRDPKVTTAIMETQFEKLLLKPLQAAETHIHGPIIIIIDALDECGDAESRGALVSLLAEEFHKLPPLFRFLITSRPDSDIADRFRNQSSIIKMHLETSVTADIQLYIESRMTEIRKRHKLEDGWPGWSAIWTLTKYSEGLFIWASTATKFLDGHRPKQKLEFILRRDPTTSFNLDQLFEDALHVVGSWEDPDFAGDARAVLAAIVFGQVPMTDILIDAIFNLQDDNSSKHILNVLGCVIQWSPGKVARTLHASFGDYLIDPERSGQWRWHLDSCTLALRCFSILKKELQFNICRLESSYVKNSDVPDLPALINKYISPQLSYSSRFWADHLAEAKYEVSIQEELLQFLQNQFLFWLEVVSVQSSACRQPWKDLSITSGLWPSFDGTSSSLNDDVGEDKDKDKDMDGFSSVSWSSFNVEYTQDSLFKGIPPENGTTRELWASFNLEDILNTVLKSIPEGAGDDLRALTKDYLSFIWLFKTLIMEAAPHIYLSALAMAPEQLLVWRQYSQQFGGIVKLTAGALPSQAVAVGGILAVAFSPDGSRIVSASDDHYHTLQVWDAKTLQSLDEPLRGYNNLVWSVAFSPDGSHIVSGSADGTLRILDAEKLQTLGEPLRGHDDRVWSVAFSPDGSRIVSCSGDRTLRIWDAETLQPLGEPLCGHEEEVRSATFSPDGSRIVSGSSDNTLRIWDAETLQPLGEPLRGHKKQVMSVTFSPDGSRIVSGSEDYTLRVWDAETFQPLGEPLCGHDAPVWSVVFSPDGSHIVSGSSDCVLRIWDTEIWQPLGEPLRGHEYWVVSVAFSPDGSRIVSGSYDGTLRIWDIKAKSEENQSQKYPIQLLHPGKPYFSSSLHLTAARNGDVWLCGPNNEHLLWFPKDWRSRLPVPPLLATGGCKEMIRFDASTFHHGKEWTKCYTGNSR